MRRSDTHVDVEAETNDAVAIDSGSDTGVVADAPVDTATDPCIVLDDMEDGDGYILHVCGRSGT